MLELFQIALVSTDLPATLRLYSEALGFRHAGAQASWGGRVQGLGPDARNIFWWAVGEQAFFQLELFHYGHPVTRPLPADWRPSDHGWVRFGVLVPEFDGTLAALARLGVTTISPPVARRGGRRAAFRDPHAGAVVEVIEAPAPARPGPAVAYVTSSVSDLAAARRFYGDALELEILPLETLHAPEDEAVWGLPGAERDGFVAGSKNIVIEVVEYRTPRGRPKPEDHRLSDQGIMNVSLGGRRAAPVARALERIRPLGLVPPFTFAEGENICGYINDREREIEFASIPEELDVVFGFTPAPLDFMSKRVNRGA
jgi:catechol 2,3-dioxygenase-like lactoylglutathione lyase family enzyme